ncbi:carbohydrate-binding domain-containing protein [Candidatus Saccharibacteria bacterium]|nr:carbohydrate-binding domain-containing protein [Candidatus Saccharibacteria bacterium]
MAKSSKTSKNTNFWGGNTASVDSSSKSTQSGAESPIMPTTSTAGKSAHRFDFKWLILAGIAIIALVVALVINFNHADNSANKVTSTIETDNGDTKINWDKYPTYDIALSDSLTLTESATYHLTGSLTDGSISIKAGDGVIRLILDGVSITNSNGPAIACYSADEFVIEVEGDNYLEDGATCSSDLDTDITGAIYSKDDLSFGGSGTLNLTAHLEDGIVGKDDLKFNSGTYNITATDDAIRGTDSVYIVDGNFTLNAGSDAIKSTNETESNKGFVLIESGDFYIDASAKGIKAINSVLIYGGNYNIKSYDDAIHSNNYVGIIGGEFAISSGDDGIHADRELIIDDGNITISKSYEGLEAQAITINGGAISITASDDGLNTGGGADSSANNRPGAGAFDADTSCVLSINGGDIYVNASGDGIDSNGYLYFNGGSVIVDGPTNNGNGALDAGLGIVLNGGTVLALGASGMAESLGTSSSIYNASIYLSATQPAGTAIEIKNSASETIISHTSAKSFSHIAVGTADFTPGSTYTLYLNGAESTSFTITGVVTTVGNSNMNFQNGAGSNGGTTGAGTGNNAGAGAQRQ